MQKLLFENVWDICVTCAECDARVKEDDSVEIHDATYCEGCVDALFVRCEMCDEYADLDDSGEVYVEGRYNEYNVSATWCESCRDAHSFRCNDCNDDVDNSGRMDCAGGICVRCYNESYFTCARCGDSHHNDDMAYCDDECLCGGCYRSSDGEDFSPRGFRSRGKVTEVGSARCFGVEIETNECDGYDELDGHPAWGAKEDCTVSGKEFYSDILSGDDGLDAVAELADLASRNGWEVGRNCGFHLHIDARGESDDSLYAMAYAFRAAQAVFLGCVEKHRSTGAYSRECCWDCADIDEDRSFYSWAGSSTRYNWINTAAYNAHNTLEVRAHEATCNARAICNWIKACTRFADWAACAGLDGVREALDGKDTAELFDFIAQVAWQDETLRAYYAEKAARLHGYKW